MYSVAYISRASDDLTENDIQEVLHSSERRNNLFGMKGILLYKDGNFLQVLEGDEAPVKALYAKICEDDRHTNLHEIFNKKLRTPIFTEYNSKFNLITSSFDLISLKSFLRRQKKFGVEDKISEKLESFLGMDWFT